MPLNLSELPEGVMINEVISEFTEYDWCVEVDRWYNEKTNEDVYINLHYTADLSSFLEDTINVNRKTKKCTTVTRYVPYKFGHYLLAFDPSVGLSEEMLKQLHTKAVIRQLVNGNKLQ